MEVYLGTVQTFGFSYAPHGWAFCNGQIMSIAQNQALFSLLGTMYGGNGSTTFGLPDLQGRRIVHMGQLQSGANYVQGTVGGVETATLTSNNMPAHSHALFATAANADTASPTNAVIAQPAGTDENGGALTLQGFAASGTLAAMAPNAIGPSGQNAPFGVLDPYQVLNVCIALEGLYPPHN